MVKNLSANAQNAGSIPGSGRSPGGGNGNPLQYSCLEFSVRGEIHGQRSWMGYSPWSHKELDRTEQLTQQQQPVITTNDLTANSNMLGWGEEGNFPTHPRVL